MNTSLQTWNIVWDPQTHDLQWKGPNLSVRAAFDAEWEGAEAGTKKRCLEERTMTEAEDGGERFMLGSERFSCGPIELIREVRYRSKELFSLDVRLTVLNRGDSALKLKRLVPLLVEGSDGLELGNKSAGDWVFYRSGRQKNDLPSVCVLGRNDNAY